MASLSRSNSPLEALLELLQSDTWSMLLMLREDTRSRCRFASSTCCCFFSAFVIIFTAEVAKAFDVRASARVSSVMESRRADARIS
eukprot:3412028-Prymnesium_polylepis.2